MTNYYTEQQRFYKWLPEFLRKHNRQLDINQLWYLVSTRFLIGKKVVRERVLLLEEMGEIALKEGKIHVLRAKSARKR